LKTRMEPFLDQQHLELRARVSAWLEQVETSAVTEADALDAAAQRWVKDLGRENLMAYVVPREVGGVRDSVQARDLCVLREAFARKSALADTMLAVQALGSYPITLAGNQEQKQRYLPGMARGETIAAFALTEPQAGSDISAIETKAVMRGNEYILSGTKQFISNAGLAESYVIFALTDAKGGKTGISAFIVAGHSPGLIVKERIRLLSPHPIGTLVFEQCRIPVNALLGREGDGLKIAFQTLDMLRCSVGAAAAGMAQRALEETLHYTRARRQFGGPLASFQATQFTLADMATELEAARLLVYQAAWAHDMGRADFKQKSSMAKLYATEAAQRIVDQALQLHGGMGVVVGTAVEQLYRDVRALRIYEGTSEIQKIVIARTLLGPK
jgi:acyl-CoA dehydrogenase